MREVDTLISLKGDTTNYTKLVLKAGDEKETGGEDTLADTWKWPVHLLGSYWISE